MCERAWLEGGGGGGGQVAFTLNNVWPSGKGVRQVRRGAPVRIRFGFPFSSIVVVCGHQPNNLSLTNYETLK